MKDERGIAEVVKQRYGEVALRVATGGKAACGDRQLGLAFNELAQGGEAREPRLWGPRFVHAHEEFSSVVRVRALIGRRCIDSAP